MFGSTWSYTNNCPGKEKLIDGNNGIKLITFWVTWLLKPIMNTHNAGVTVTQYIKLNEQK